MSTEETIKQMEVSSLTFDIRNPRLVDSGLKDNSTEDEIIEVLWKTMDVKELVMSIAASGFFSHEPIIVAKENGKNVVIEGNRRLAAVKLLLDPTLALKLNLNVPPISTDARLAIQEIPVVFNTREEAWRYLGFKHVNGPAKWSSYAKSQYIADVHRKYGVSLEDIATQIGDTHRTVQRLFRGLMVVEQAEDMKVFDRRDRWNTHFSFSHLYAGIGYDGIGPFIGLRDASEEKEQPVPIENKSQLGDLCLWLYGSKRDNKQPVIRSQNPGLMQLNAVIKSREAVAALRSGIELSRAFEMSRPPSNVFEEALHSAKRELEKAHSLLSTGYDGSKHLLDVADDVAQLADDLHEAMERKNQPRSKRRSSRSG